MLYQDFAFEKNSDRTKVWGTAHLSKVLYAANTVGIRTQS